LMLAIYDEKEELSKLLIEKGANVNHKNENGDFALYFAIEANLTEITKLLIKNGADVNA